MYQGEGRRVARGDSPPASVEEPEAQLAGPRPEFFAGWPDDRFPYIPGRCQAESLIVHLPHRGHLLQVRCVACGHVGGLTGDRLCREFTPWLRRAVGDLARALRCSVCDGRRLMVTIENDLGADGFRSDRLGADATMTWARRLHAWLGPAGLNAHDFRAVLDALPNDAELALDGVHRRGP